MRLLFIALCISCSFTLSAQEYSAALMAAKMDLDSAWFNVERPVDKICLPAESNMLRKKDMSDHACMEESIKMAKLEGAQAAIPWLLATFCHNQPAQDRVNRAGEEAVRYVMNQWGGGEGTIAGTRPAAAAEPVVIKPVRSSFSTQFSATNRTESGIVKNTSPLAHYNQTALTCR